MWLPDGQALYFDRDHQMFRLAVNTKDLSARVEPTPLPIKGFAQGEYRRQFDLMPDGRQFLMLFRSPVGPRSVAARYGSARLTNGRQTEGISGGPRVVSSGQTSAENLRAAVLSYPQLPRFAWLRTRRSHVRAGPTTTFSFPPETSLRASFLVPHRPSLTVNLRVADRVAGCSRGRLRGTLAGRLLQGPCNLRRTALSHLSRNWMARVHETRLQMFRSSSNQSRSRTPCRLMSVFKT